MDKAVTVKVPADYETKEKVRKELRELIIENGEYMSDELKDVLFNVYSQLVD